MRAPACRLWSIVARLVVGTLIAFFALTSIVDGFAPAGAGTPDPTQLPVATTSQFPLTTAYNALNVRSLAAGGTYRDPATGVTIYKLTSGTYPVSSPFWSHDYSDGGNEVSLPYNGNTRAVLVRQNSTSGGPWWLLDFTPGVGVSNPRQLSGTLSPFMDGAFTFSNDPTTPYYAYVSNGSTIVRFDIRTLIAAPGNGWPRTESSATWLHQSENDGLFVWMLGANGTTVVGYEPSTGTRKTYTNANLNEPRIDRAGRYIGICMNTPSNGLVVWDWQTNTILWSTDGTFPFAHNASLRSRWVTVDWNLSFPDEFSMFTPGVPNSAVHIGGPAPGTLIHGSGNWVQHPADLNDQWAVFLAYGSLYPTGSAWLAPGGMILMTPNGERRLLAHAYNVTSTYNYSSFAKFAPDGQYVLFTSDMNGSGRSDVFLVELPQTAANPAPTLSALTPSSAPVGTAGLTLTANGTNFTSGSVVLWNGGARTTTFVSSTQLTAVITVADLATAGTASVAVSSPGAGTSAALTFTITLASNPAPTLSSLAPGSAVVGSSAFTLTATGTNFVAGSTVQWNGAARTTTFVSPTQLTAAITAADLATAGTAQVTVFTPTPGGGTSAARTFAINNAVPTISSLSPASTLLGGAAFTLTVNGTGFVNGSTVQWNGAARTTTFVSATQLTAAITAADLATAGTANVTVMTPTPGGGTSAARTFAINNPVPAISGVVPGSAFAGGLAFTLTVNGANFQNGSTVQWNGGARTTTFVSATQLTAPITAADIATAGTAQVTVFTPTPGGGTSAAQTFPINNPIPTITGLVPTSATVGGAAFTLTVNGTGFVNGSTVQWSGAARTTTFVSPIQLTAAIAATDIAAAGTANVTVVTPTPGGGTTAAQAFPIVSGGPTLTSLSPSSAGVGGPAFTLTANGSSFLLGDTVQWNGAARTTTFVSTARLTAAIPASDLAAVGTVPVTVVRSGPLGGASGALTFSINNPAPAISSLAPASAQVGGAAFTLMVNGTGLTSGSSVRWNGAARTTTVVSATQLTAAIAAADIATAATVPVTVVTPAPGGGTSAAQTFSVTYPAPTLTSVSPTSATAGAAAFTLTATGSNFVTGSTVQWNGAARTTTFVSATQLTAAITAADIAAAGPAQVTVLTPTPGGGASTAQTFTVNNPSPLLSGLAPSAATAGTGPLTLVANGSGFVNGSTIRWNAVARTTTFVSSTQLMATISATDVAAAGTAQVSAGTPAPGGGVSGSIGFAINAASTVNVGLAGYWRFDEGSDTTAGDSTGLAGPGVLVNGPVWTSGRLGQAIAFDGVDDYVQMTSANNLNAYPLTVAAWIKAPATTGVSGIVSKAVAGAGDGYAVYLNGGNLCASFFRNATSAVDDGSGCPLATGGYADNQWHQVTYVVDASGGRLYVDGVSRASLGWTGTPGAPSTSLALQVGRYPGAPAPQYFAGSIDDVRVYGRALSASEVMELYTNFGSVSDTTPPVISGLAVLAPTSNSATITWTTNESSDTQVEYGVTTAYGSMAALQPALVTAHTQTLSGLAAGTTYFVRVRSRDFAGNLAISSGQTFRTTDAAAAPPPGKKKKRKSVLEEIFGGLGWLF